jgi:hypothetical protein
VAVVSSSVQAKQITETGVVDPQLLEFDQQIDQVLFLVTAHDGHPCTVDARSETCKRNDQSRGPLKNQRRATAVGVLMLQEMTLITAKTRQGGARNAGHRYVVGSVEKR